jgi:hypothetical protein
MSLLFKKGDPLLLDNFRPISLLNVDLKILSHVLVQRLKKILSKLINEDQTGYIKNRFIGRILSAMISTDSTNRRADKGPPSNPSGVSKHFRYPSIINDTKYMI